MKKVLILTYFFPPCNLPAAMRAFGWAHHLKEFGYWPIIITRHWGHQIQNTRDSSKASGERILHQIFENFEVYYLPFEPLLRDRLFARYGDSRLRIIRRMLSFIELLTQNYTNFLLPYRNMFRFTGIFLKRNPNIKSIIITANPFVMFRWGFLLKKNKNINWIADYRDDWNTSELTQKKFFVERILNRIEAQSERKWVPTAQLFTTVSDHYVHKIEKFLNIRGEVLHNGYSEEDFSKTNQPALFNEFTVLYNGSLYPTQRIEIFIEGFRLFLNEHKNLKAHVLFPGLSFNKQQEKRVVSLISGIEDHIMISDRVPHEQILALQSMCHALLIVSHEGLKGIPSSKLYEYIGVGKPIIVCPPDGDIIERTLKEYNLTYFCRSANDTREALNKLYAVYLNGKYTTMNPDESFRKKFSRRNETGKLAQLLGAMPEN